MLYAYMIYIRTSIYIFISTDVNGKNGIDVVCDFSACDGVQYESLCELWNLNACYMDQFEITWWCGVKMASPFPMCVERNN